MEEQEEEKKRQEIALFRFGVIAPLIGLRREQRGTKEKLLQQISARQWEIPHSARSYVGRSTALGWLLRYQQSGRKLESLYPQHRSDRGRCRVMDEETQHILIQLKKELGAVTVPALLKVARERGLLPARFAVSRQSVYRLLKDIGESEPARKDRRRFEAELPNDLWQSDCMHGPTVQEGGRLRKSFLFAFIDDHSRLIPHAAFYLQENLGNFLICLRTALHKRGLPRKLYVDNGSCFRSHLLAHITASLGITLIHCTPYQAEGKGKIERWFRTLRLQLLPTLPEKLTLSRLNELLWEWIEQEYHLRIHGSTRCKPLDRYLEHIKLIRPAPANLDDYFRHKASRKVYKDRTVFFLGKVYEAPVGLIDKRVTLLFDPKDSGRVEVVYNGSSHGFLVPLHPHVNLRLKRTPLKTVDVQLPADAGEKECDAVPPADAPPYNSGKLFDPQDEQKEK